MKRLPRYLFYAVIAIYALYNFLWVVGITFSYSKNDNPSELIYLLFTFLLDIPIIWYLSKNLKRGLLLLIVVLVIGVLDGIVQWHIEGIEVLALWYGPKLIPIVFAILLNHSESAKNSSNLGAPSFAKQRVG